MTVASDWLRAKMMVVSSTRELRPLMKIYTKEITSKKIIGMTQYLQMLIYIFLTWGYIFLTWGKL